MNEQFFRKAGFHGYNADDVNAYIVATDAKIHEMNDANASALADVTEKLERSEKLLETVNATNEALQNTLKEKNDECAALHAEKEEYLSELETLKTEIVGLKQSNADLVVKASEDAKLSEKVSQLCEEVTTYTDKLSEQYVQSDEDRKTIEEQAARIAELTEQLERLSEQKELFDQVEENIDQILEEVRAEAEEIRSKAVEEAAQIRQNAQKHLEAAEIRAKQIQAEQRPKKTESILDRIRKLKESIKED